MGLEYLFLDSNNAQIENFETTGKVFEVPTSDTEPYVSALWVFSYLAYRAHRIRLGDYSRKALYATEQLWRRNRKLRKGVPRSQSNVSDRQHPSRFFSRL